MKNKKVTYALGILLLFLWGTVFYKIFSNSSEDFEVVPPEEYNFVQIDSSFTPKPKFELNIDYTDPFLGKGKVYTFNSPQFDQELPEATKPKIIKPPIKEVLQKRWPKIQYLGFVDNQVNIKIDNRSYLIEKGDSIKGVGLIQFWSDSVQLRLDNEFKIYQK